MAVKLIPSAMAAKRWLLFVPLFLGVWMAFQRPLSPDGDLFLHLKSGELISKSFQLPTHDQFTFTARESTEEVHSWLSQVLFWQVYNLSGETGLRVLQALCLAGLFLLAFSFLVRRQVGWWLTFFTLTSLMLLQREILVIRPLMFGQLCFAVAASLLLDSRVKWWGLVLVAVIWGNLHGSVVILGPLSLCFALTRMNRLSRRDFLGMVAVMLATLAHPQPFGTYQMALAIPQIAKLAGIWEWVGRQPLDFSDGVLRLSLVYSNLFILAAIGLGALLWRRRKDDRLPALLILLFSFLPLLASRHLVYLFLPLLLLAAESKTTFKNLPRLAVPFALVALFILGRSIPGVPRDPELASLERAANFLKSQSYRGEILNYPGWGSYLIFKGYPDWKVMADRRLWVNRNFYSMAASMERDLGGLDVARLSELYPAAKVAIFHKEADTTQLRSQGWKPVFTDDNVMVFGRAPLNSERLTWRRP